MDKKYFVHIFDEQHAQALEECARQANKTTLEYMNDRFRNTGVVITKLTLPGNRETINNE